MPKAGWQARLDGKPPPRYTSPMRAADLLVPRPEGLYCPKGGFHIDPTRPVERALITHAHSDHATRGHGAVLATRETLDIMAIRLGADFAARVGGATFGIPHRIGDVTVTFHPAGHVLGSAQIAVETRRRPHRRLRRLQAHPRPDLRALRARPLRRLHHRGDLRASRSSATRRPQAEIAPLLASLAQFPERTHLVGVYALGKAQRVLRLLRDAGYDAPSTSTAPSAASATTTSPTASSSARSPTPPSPAGRGSDFAGAIVLGPPSAFASPLGPPLRRPAHRLRLGLDAGPRPRPPARRRAAARPLRPLRLDRAHRHHRRTRPAEVWVTHGREEALVRWCALQGLPARPLHLVGYEDEAE